MEFRPPSGPTCGTGGTWTIRKDQAYVGQDTASSSSTLKCNQTDAGITRNP